MKGALFFIVTLFIRLYLYLFIEYHFSFAELLSHESSLSRCKETFPWMHTSMDYMSSIQTRSHIESCSHAKLRAYDEASIKHCEAELRRIIDRSTSSIRILSNDLKQRFSSMLSSPGHCSCFNTIAQGHIYTQPLITAISNYCQAIETSSATSPALQEKEFDNKAPHFNTNAVSEVCSNKMKIKCGKHPNSYQESVECFFKYVTNLQYLCDDNLMSAFLAGIFTVCNKDLLSDTCITTLKPPYDSYDVMNCLQHNFATISPSCRLAIEGLNGDNIPCASDSTKYCKDIVDITDFFSCMSDTVDEALISQSCLATVDGYNRCKYPDSDDDEVLSYGDNKVVGDDDDDDDEAPGDDGSRRLQDSVKKSSICWAKIYIADDDDDGSSETPSPSKQPSTSTNITLHKPGNDDYHPDASDDADDDDSTVGKSKAAVAESSISSGLVRKFSSISCRGFH
jgi:hypothetical protein